MDQTPVFSLELRWAWWWPLYLHGLGICAALTGREPDWNKVEKVIERAMRVRTVRNG
jgi:hypothetical protein